MCVLSSRLSSSHLTRSAPHRYVDFHSVVLDVFQYFYVSCCSLSHVACSTNTVIYHLLMLQLVDEVLFAYLCKNTVVTKTITHINGQKCSHASHWFLCTIFMYHSFDVHYEHRRIADEYCGGAAVTKFPTKYFCIEHGRIHHPRFNEGSKCLRSYHISEMSAYTTRLTNNVLA